MSEPGRPSPAPFFGSADDVVDALTADGYLAHDLVGDLVHLAERMQKPILVEGPAGTGKTELARTVARTTGSRLIRLQCYEGLDESRVLFEWNYRKQLLRIQAESVLHESGSWSELDSDLFGEDFLLARPVLEALQSPERVVLLIDEVDRIELETEALLLEALSDYQVSIPELGKIKASSIPLVFLTSNGTRDLSEALKRRCLFLHLDYPSVERETEIIRHRVPGLEEHLAREVAALVRTLRGMGLKKAPSVSETLDWATALLLRERVEPLDEKEIRRSLPLLLKYRDDVDDAIRRLAEVLG